MEQDSDLRLVHVVRPARKPERAGQAGTGTPGLLMLHGRGADEYDLMGLKAGLDPRLTIVSARAPYKLGPGFAWYDMAQIGRPDEETFHAGLAVLQEFVRDLPGTYGIDPARLYLLGFSQGAIMSSALALTMPSAVRGVIMHSGYVPAGSGLDMAPGGVEGKGFFVAHGLYDDVIPVAYGREAAEFLRSQNARLTYNEYPIGHSISEESLYDLSDWLTNELEG